MSQQHVVEGEDHFEEDGPAPNGASSTVVEQHYDTPDDGELVTTNVAAHWDQEESGPVRFTMQGIRLMDNTQTKAKSSALIMCTTLAPAKLLVAGSKTPENKDGIFKEYPAGTGFGIWAKPGMQSLQNLQGAHIWMAPDGFQAMKDASKQPMALFKVVRLRSSPTAGSRVTLIDDVRKESRKEPALAKTPPWWLIVLGDDFGKAKAQREILNEMQAAVAASPS